MTARHVGRLLACALEKQADRIIGRQQAELELRGARHEAFDTGRDEHARGCAAVEHARKRLVRRQRPHVIQNAKHLFARGSVREGSEHLVARQPGVEILLRELEVHRLLQIAQHGVLAKREKHHGVEARGQRTIKRDRRGRDGFAGAAHALHRDQDAIVKKRSDAADDGLSYQIAAREVWHLGWQHESAARGAKPVGGES